MPMSWGTMVEVKVSAPNKRPITPRTAITSFIGLVSSSQPIAGIPLISYASG